MRDAFSTFHPIVGCAWFASVLLLTMFIMHPICLGVSLCCAVAYSVYLNGKKAVRFNLIFLLPLLIVTGLINPAFNHAGATILTYFSSGNPLTLESILYGIAAATMLASVICWFSCLNTVLTPDKYLYLLGRIIPSLSLVVSMTLRFVPGFKAQIGVVANAQKGIARGVSNGSLRQRVQQGIRILSIMVTWALENAIVTADSMKSRGFGLPGRTAFSIYRFDQRDKKALLGICLAAGYLAAGAVTGGLSYRYYPTVKQVAFNPYSLSLYAGYLSLCIAPVIINLREDWKWRATQSGI